MNAVGDQSNISGNFMKYLLNFTLSLSIPAIQVSLFLLGKGFGSFLILR
jgi:hypothetical protein